MSILYVHIGTHKTGTTSLQNFLYTNRTELEERGLVYPEFGLHKRLKGHHPIAFRLADRKKLMGEQLGDINVEDIFDKINRILEGGQSVLLSSEDFAGFSLTSSPSLASRLSSMLPGTTLFRIIVYLRRQDQFINSYYAWERKGNRLWPATLDLRYVRQNRYFPYSKLLDRWEAVYGRDSLIVRPFERESFIGGNVIDDFCNQVGLSEFTARRPMPQHAFNPALTARKLQVIDYIRDSVAGPGPAVGSFAKQFVNTFADRLKLNRGGTQFVSPTLATAILEMFSEDNRSIASKYLGREQLFLNESVLDSFEESELLTTRELNDLEGLVKEELVRFSGQKASVTGGLNPRSGLPLRIRPRFVRRQWEIGTRRISIGRLARVTGFLMGRLRR